MTSSAAARARARRQIRGTGIEPAPVRRTPERESDSHLRVVPQPETKRRSVTSRATIVAFGICTFISAVVIFQATIAEQQLRLDALTRDLRMAESNYDKLRQERAELEMPSRLREEAVMMGMYQGFSSKFLEVPPEVVAEVMASTSKMNPLFAEPSAAVASAGVIAQADPIAEGR